MEESSGSFHVAALRRAFGLARGALALLGLGVSFAVAFPSVREALVPPSPLAQAGFAAIHSGQPAVIGIAAESTTVAEVEKNPEQRALSEFIAKRYRVAEEAITGIVSSAYRAGAEHRVDPLLILAVVAVESRFNPVAESVFGAKGLMQVLPKYHREKLSEHGGETALLEPEVNIQVGTQILREYLRRSGETEGALQMYLGGADESASLYTGKVLAERARLQQLAERTRQLAERAKRLATRS
ncbi:MAG TPA: transglycosylase SLT domain-containing protein [Burkholderiales bacterium]|nr:transglycosylase SLT domain-containing protein [Burkholderiales bacterium]